MGECVGEGVDASSVVVYTHTVSPSNSRRPQIPPPAPVSSPSPFALIGHSLGGKVAMEALRLMSSGMEEKATLPRRVWTEGLSVYTTVRE